MCWDFIFDWFLYAILRFFISSILFYFVCVVVVLADEPIPPPVVVISSSCTLFSVSLLSVLSRALSLSISFCCVFLLLLRFVVSFVVCFVRVLFVAVLLSLRSLTHVFFFGPVIRYTLTHQLACSLSLSLFRSIASAFGCVRSLFVVVVASWKSRTS